MARLFHAICATVFYKMSIPILCCLGGSLLVVPAFATGAVVPVTPLAQWRLEAPPGDIVTLTAEGTALRIKYDVDLKTIHQVTHMPYRQETFRLYLNHPIALTKEQTRVIYEARGMMRPFFNNSLVLVPMVRDAHGELLLYQPNPYPNIGAPSTNWTRWTSPYFYLSDAGGSTPDVYEAEGGDGNCWPDGKLTFVGFQGQIRGDQFGRKQGEFSLGKVTLAGKFLTYENPRIYADNILTSKGEYQVLIRVTNEYQGKSLREFSTKLSYDPASLDSRKQFITIPLGPDDNYWVTYQVINSKGESVAGTTLTYQVEKNPSHTLPQYISNTTVPILSYLRINPAQHTNGVYENNEPLKVIVRVFAKGATRLSLHARLRQYIYDTTVEEQSAPVEFNGQPYRDIPLYFNGEVRRNAYRLNLEVTRDNKIVDRQDYTLGQQTDFTTPRPVPAGKIYDRDYVKQSSYFRFTYVELEGNDRPKSETASIAQFRAFIEESSKITRYVTYMIDLADFEILPGVYNFSILDKVMDIAAEYGCAVTIRLGHIDGQVLYSWQKFSGQYSFDGMKVGGHPYYGTYAQTHEENKALWLRAYAACYKRYKEHPGFQGYFILQPGGEWTTGDWPLLGTISGYEVVSRPAFRTFLQQKGYTLKTLNTRWNTHYKSWSEVQAPQPELEKGKTPDLRLCWIDFCAFKASQEASWFEEAARSIRAYDTTHVILSYSGDPTGRIGLYDYLHNGGILYLRNEGKLTDAWNTGHLGWITEPHHPQRWAAYGDPDLAGWPLDFSTYVMLAQAGGGGANLHIYYLPNPTMSLTAHYGESYAFDRFERMLPVLRELQKAKLLELPKEVGVLHDPYTQFAKNHVTGTPWGDDIFYWFNLLRIDMVDYEDMNPEHMTQYKLLLPNVFDEVMSGKSIELLDRQVRNGGRMIMCANTGKYCPEAGEKETFVLLRRLGITPPAGPYIINEAGVHAQVSAENPLFDKGTQVAFYSLAQFQQESQDRTIQDHYQSWPYHFFPATDYFGYYRENTTTNGTVLARFPSGGVALSLHKVGQGEVLVFWGIPDYKPALLTGMMARAASWAGVNTPRRGSPIPYTQEMHSDLLGRHYAVMFQETKGAYLQRLPQVPDGNWFLDDLMTGQRLGTATGKELRETGIHVTYVQGYPPLKIIRMMPVAQTQADWVNKYQPVETK